MRIVALTLALLTVCVASANAATSLLFKRADGSAIAFPNTIRTFYDGEGLHVVTLGSRTQSRWQIGVARAKARSGRVLRFTWASPNGVEVFVYDAKTRNEASEGAEGSRGRVELQRATCRRGGRIEIGLSGVLASEFSDDKPVRASGTFVGRIGTRPR
jgi:hypothetical protein